MIDYKIKYIYLKNLYNKLKQNNKKFIGGMEDNSESNIKKFEEDTMENIYKILNDINEARIETYEQFLSLIDDILTSLESSLRLRFFYSYIGDRIKNIIDFINDTLNEYKTQLTTVSNTSTETIIKQFETMKNKLNIIGEKKEVKSLDTKPLDTKPSSENNDEKPNPNPPIPEDDVYGTPFARTENNDENPNPNPLIAEDDVYGTPFARTEDKTSSDDNLTSDFALGNEPPELQETQESPATPPPTPPATPPATPPSLSPATPPTFNDLPATPPATPPLSYDSDYSNSQTPSKTPEQQLEETPEQQLAETPEQQLAETPEQQAPEQQLAENLPQGLELGEPVMLLNSSRSSSSSSTNSNDSSVEYTRSPSSSPGEMSGGYLGSEYTFGYE